jgi:hypothetical protein
VKDAEVAALPLIVTAPPTCVPPLAQFGGVPPGPQTKNFTEPVTAPFWPTWVNVAVSVTEAPREMLEALTCVAMPGVGATEPAERERS